AAVRVTDPWVRLATAYRFIGNEQALDRLLKRQPATAVFIADLFAANQDWERAIIEYRKAIAAKPTDGELLAKLTAAYMAAGRARVAVPYRAKASAANPSDTLLSLEVAARQAWFGQEKELAATRQRILEFAKGTDNHFTANQAAKACSILP